VKTKFVWFLPLVAAALAGCNSKPAIAEVREKQSDSVKLFEEGKGVWFSDETKKLFSLETVEVSEKPMQHHMEKTAQVYRTGREGVPASAMVLLSSKEANELKAGQPLTLKGRNTPETSGVLVRLDNQAQHVLGEVEGLVEFDDAQQRYPAGEFVTVTFTNGNAKPVFVVPESALLTAADGSYVYAVNGSHLTRTRVKRGETSGGLVEIEDGLYTGDLVAAQGVESLWLVELSAIKGGAPCCPVPKKNGEK